MRNDLDFLIKNRFHLNSDLYIARFALIDHVIENKKPLTISEANTIISKSTINSKFILDEMIKENIIGLNSNNEISYLYPVSANPTGYKVFLEDGRWFYGMCAVDSLGCATTFKQNVTIEASCTDTAEPIKLEINFLNDKLLNYCPEEDYFVSYYDKWNDDCVNL